MPKIKANRRNKWSNSTGSVLLLTCFPPNSSFKLNYFQDAIVLMGKIPMCMSQSLYYSMIFLWLLQCISKLTSDDVIWTSDDGKNKNQIQCKNCAVRLSTDIRRHDDISIHTYSEDGPFTPPIHHYPRYCQEQERMNMDMCMHSYVLRAWVWEFRFARMEQSAVTMRDSYASTKITCSIHFVRHFIGRMYCVRLYLYCSILSIHLFSSVDDKIFQIWYYDRRRMNTNNKKCIRERWKGVENTSTFHSSSETKVFHRKEMVVNAIL